MWPVIPQGPTLFIMASMFVVTMISIRWIQPEWWNTRAVRAGVFVAFAGMFVGLSIWAIGRGAHALSLVHLGAGIAYVGILVLGPAVALLPFSAGLDRAVVAIAKRRRAKRADSPEDAGLSRRSVLRAGSASLPLLGAITGASGFSTAKSAPRLPVVKMTYEGLHPDLHGLRILQLSDVHLGASIGIDDLEEGLAIAIAKQRPDLIVLTGDLADDPALIGPAMELVTRANARYGALASLGNHEYLHGIEVTRPKYEKSAVPLLVSNGKTLHIGKARLFVGGADDPVHMGGDIAWMLSPSIRAAAKAAPPDADFRLLLCHRPEGFGPAVENGFDLVLSGHTHGGQLGLFGRSLLEMLRPGIGWWGRYAKPRPSSETALRSKLAGSPSRLYTTSGFGHWFPFRLGCPTEMPLIVLERGPSTSAVAAMGMTAESRTV